MKLRTLTIGAFRSHEKLVIQFPDSGLILLVGHNGSGKSGVPEALEWVAFEQVLRGGNPLRLGEVAEVEAVFEGDEIFEVRRRRKGSRKEVAYKDHRDPPADGKWVKASTPTETQFVVERALGSPVAFRHACIFSADMTDTFTTANDRARKQLIERLGGITDIADAELVARKDRKPLQEAVTRKQSEAASAKARLEERASATQAAIADKPDPAGIKAVTAAGKLLVKQSAKLAKEADALDEAFNELDTQYNAASAAHGKAREEDATAQATWTGANDRAEHFADEIKAAGALAGDCPTCRRVITKATRGKIVEALNAALNAATDTANELVDRCTATSEAAVEARALMSKLADERRDKNRDRVGVRQAAEAAERKLLAARQEVQSMQKAADGAAARVETAKAGTVEARELLEARRQELEAAVRELDVLDAAILVLSPKGVRAKMLASRLASLGHAATHHLRHMGLPWTLVLAPTRELKGGGERDEISLEVRGGSDYEDASRGERRRIDVSIVLAFAQLAGAWTGDHGDLPMFFDEVFDGLDRRGREAVAEILTELARNRPVVVITHRPEMRDHLQPDHVWVASRGPDRADPTVIDFEAAGAGR